MDGFVTLAVGAEYLQRATAFAVSAMRFGFPTTLVHRDTADIPHRATFFKCVSVDGRALCNLTPRRMATECKKYVYEATPEFSTCAYCDADSLVIRNPKGMFDALRGCAVT
jgi:hypothetical protein